MKLKNYLVALLACVGMFAGFHSDAAADAAYWSWAPTPPMGWNSWDGFATTVTEAQTRA